MINLDFLLESFRRNALANQRLLAQMLPTDLETPGMKESWNVGQLLAHMLYGRTGWLRELSPAHAATIPAIASGTWSPKQLLVTNFSEIAEAFRIADHAALSAVHENASFQGHFESHPAHFLQLLIVHDATHRGHILAALRIAGRTPAQMQVLEDACWDPWFE